MTRKKQGDCTYCTGKATNFHSACCHAHFEGVINDDGTYSITCEKCGKWCADIKE